jgi:hypothetical protein
MAWAFNGNENIIQHIIINEATKHIEFGMVINSFNLLYARQSF